ncbi:pancreatic triacylglycerol lipase-like isoform X2 [Epargyreus clarus]
MFYVFGFSETPESTDTTLILSAYLKKNYTNVLLVDWLKEASKEFVGEELSYAFKVVPLARYVGIQLGKALISLSENGLDPNMTHLVGHSLGAQVAGFAGETTREKNIWLPRITGLDPAGPLFQGVVNNNGLNPSRAKFVDVLHTDPRRYGVISSIGSVDFWANCNLEVQPGCTVDNSDSENSFCSHQRSCGYFSEAILNPQSFPAVQASNCSSWGQNTSNSAVITFLGDAVDISARGNFYFSTNSGSPYSKGRNGLVPNK